jgi:hypothetical protein
VLVRALAAEVNEGTYPYRERGADYDAENVAPLAGLCIHLGESNPRVASVRYYARKGFTQPSGSGYRDASVLASRLSSTWRDGGFAAISALRRQPTDHVAQLILQCHVGIKMHAQHTIVERHHPTQQ